MALVFGAALVGYLGAVVVIALVAPVLLRPLVVAAVVLALFAWWRSRPSFGAARGLPPGSLRVAPIGPWVDPDYFARDGRRFGPVFKSTTLVAPTLCVVGLPAALDLFEKHDSSLVPPTNRFSRFIPRGFIRYMTDGDHATYAPILRSAVSGAVTREAEAQMAAMIRNELIAAAGGEVRVGELTRRIVQRLFLRLFFGIEADDRDLPRLEQLYQRIDPTQAWRSRPGRIQSAVDEIARIVGQREVAQSYLAAARQAHGESADDVTVVKNLVYMAQTGAADVSALLAWVVWMLSTNDGWVERLRTSGDIGPAARRVVMEAVRMEQSEFILRRATDDIRWQGFTIPRGWRVRICVRESHRDPSVFTDPDRFDPDRFLGDPIPRHDYSAFGASTTRTRCLGEGLTLTVGRLFVEQLVCGFDWSVIHRGEPEFSGVHWRPSSRFSVALTPR